MKKISVVFLTLALMLGLSVPVFSEEKEVDLTKPVTGATEDNSFTSYMDAYSKLPLPAVQMVLTSENVQLTEGVTIKTVGTISSLFAESGKSIYWRVSVEQEGMYRCTLRYKAGDTSGRAMKIGIKINGQYPFQAAESISLNRVWQDDGDMKKDNCGNDIAPLQKEADAFVSAVLDDTGNYVADSYLFYLSPGENTIAMLSTSQPLYVESLTLGQLPLPTYAAYRAQIQASDTEDKYIGILEAEKGLYKSSSNFMAIHDGSNPSISPNDPCLIRLNVVGGDDWNIRGQWASWEITVPRDGFYTLSFKYKQEYLRGLDVKRRLYIDNEVLFAEMDSINFAYSKRWAYSTLSNADGDCPVYLTQGTHVLKLEIQNYEMNRVLRSLNEVLTNLNDIYRRIIMITGPTPDPYNDYYLHKQIPELHDAFENAIAHLRDSAEYMETHAGTNGSEASVLYEVVRQLEDFNKDPNSIPLRLDRYKSNLSTLATLFFRMRESPLRLDNIAVTSGGEALPPVEAPFGQFLKFRFESFLASFYNDYASLGNQYSQGTRPLDVWISAGGDVGRDQAILLKRFVDNIFTPQTGIPVNLSLIGSSDTLLQAIIGGQQPDLALFVPKTLPINLAMRNAAEDISHSPYMEKWKKRANEAAFIPFRYLEGIYGMPETQTYSMLYYRRDIFRQLELNPPETWTDFYAVAARLQENHLEAGISGDETTFYMMLMQNGQTVYNEDLSQVNLNSPEAIQVFRDWTNLYTLYGIPVAYDFFNRFRTGEMPMGIVPITMYNQLVAAAPEIDGLWGMVPVPGTLRNGVIYREQPAQSSASVILSKAKNKDGAYAFIDWWTSADVQVLYGNAVEGIMGPSGRYYSANPEVQSQQAWSPQEKAQLELARSQLTDVPQTPATYYLSRNINNAFRKVVYNFGNPREVLNKYCKDINDELMRKRQEFGLN